MAFDITTAILPDPTETTPLSHLVNTTTTTTTTTESAGTGEGTRCHYGSLTGNFGIFIQFLLASLAFSCLIIKRFCEPVETRRSWRIWFYDTSKQGFGATVIHFVNIFISQSADDPCIWYVMNFLLDSTLGLLFIYICLRLISLFARCCSLKDLRNGEYGEPPRCSRWLIQCVIYILVMLAEKGVIMALMTFSIWETISRYIVSPIKSAELELLLVMFVIPIVVNVIMFWIVDNLLMRNLRLPRLRSRSSLLSYSKLKTEADDNDVEPHASN